MVTRIMGFEIACLLSRNYSASVLTVDVYKLHLYLPCLCYFSHIYHNLKSTDETLCFVYYKKSKSVPLGLEWPRVFQEVKVPRFLDNSTGRW